MLYPPNYSYRVTWNEYEEWLGMFVQKSFNTVKDTIESHVASLKKREFDEEGNQNITCIKVEKIS